MVAFSLLDLCPIISGGTAAQAFANTLDLAQHAEKWGYQRYWLAEHHSMAGVASAATSVVIGHVAAGTKTIRVGAGGIMLPNHAPLVIAEQFGTLESLFPGRIDLGLGRAPGSDQRTMMALRRSPSNADSFPRDVQELQHYFGPVEPGQGVFAVPGAGLKVPLWILGSSTFGAQLAAALGLPYVFAAHFSPDSLHEAIAIYRRQFQPSTQLQKPYVAVGYNVFAAETDEQAAMLFTSLQQLFLNLRRGTPGQTPPPANMDTLWTPMEKRMVDHALRCSAIGSPAMVQVKIAAFLDEVKPDELILTGQIFDHQARLRSFEIAANVMQHLNAQGTA